MDKNKEQEIKDFLNFIIAEAKSKGKDPNAYAKELGEDGMKEAYKRFQALKLKKAQKAAHGTKLQYFRTLKNQCAEDEELYYYKKGGSVGCGCKKKEDGGEMKPKKDCGGGPVAKFKKMRQGGLPKVVNGSTKQPTIQGTTKMQEEFKRKLREKERQRKIDEQSLKDYEEGNNGNSDNPPDSKAMSKEYIKKQESKKRSSGGYHTIMADKCGSKVVKKFKKHYLGGSLNSIPFYLEGTPKGGVKEKSDNTRVQRIPNNGEGVYEQIPVNGWNFVPVIGTLKEAKMLDQGDPNASKLGFATSMGMDLLGAGMIGPVLKASVKASRLSKLLKSRGFNKITEQGVYRSQPNTYMKVAPETIKHLYYNVTQPTVRFKLVPTVDVSGVALLPLVLTLRVPTQTMAH